MTKFASAVMAIFSIFMIPIAVLNFLGGIVGGIWIAVLGMWPLLAAGLCAIFFGHFLISLLLAPSLILIAPVAWALNRGHIVIGSILALPSVLWAYLLMVIWCAMCFFACINATNGHHLFPTLLWGYAIATSPWTYLAQFEARSDANAPAILTSFASQVGCLIFMIEVLVNGGLPQWNTAIISFGIPLLFAFVIQVSVVISESLAQHRQKFE